MKNRVALFLYALFILIGRDICAAQSPKKKLTYQHMWAKTEKAMKEYRKKRPVYKKLTVAIIDQTKDSELLDIVFSNMLTKMAPDMSNEFEVVMGLSREREAIFMIMVLDEEIGNGGFNQYYYNSTGRYAPLTPDALKFIGADKHAALVSNANDVYAAQADSIQKHQNGTLEGFSKSYVNNPLNKFDKQYYALSDKINLEKLMVAFIRKNKKQFIDE